MAASFACVLASAALLGPAAGRAAEAGQKPDGSRSELQQKLEAAQQRLDVAAREVADLSMSLSGDVFPGAGGVTTGGRAMLGVNIGSRRSDDRADGVEIISVSPGGAAAEAGLRAGDVLVEANGKALKRDDDATPRSKLLGEMREVTPGEKMNLKFVRDGKTTMVDVTPEAAENHMFFNTFGGPTPFPPGMSVGLGEGPHFAYARAMGVFGSAELVPLTPKLGQYFGADKGLLVVRAPSDSRLKLEEGDVIVDIAGRVPTSPTHALRILGSYQGGEQLKLNVLRMKKRMSFDITIPEDLAEPDEASGFRFRKEFHLPERPGD
jgi:S1-C subfamily serine protease